MNRRDDYHGGTEAHLTSGPCLRAKNWNVKREDVKRET